MSQIQTWKLQTNAPVQRAIYETLSDRELASLRGSLIMRRHSALRTFDLLTERKNERARHRAAKTGRESRDDMRASTTPFLILFSMAVLVGEIRDGCDGLMVYGTRDPETGRAIRPVDRIADAVGIGDKTAVQLLRDLEEVGAIRAIKQGGVKPHLYEVVMPSKTDEEIAEDARLAQENADGIPSADGMPSSSDVAKPLQETNLLDGIPSADGMPSSRSDGIPSADGMPSTSRFAKSDSGTEFGGARATPSTSAAPLNNDIDDNIITEGEGSEDADKLALICELHDIGLPPYRVRQFAETVTIRQAVAVRIHCSKIKKPGFNPVGLAIKKLSDPENEIAEKDLEAADRELNPGSKPAAAPTKASKEISSEKALERRVDQAIDSLTPAQLQDLRVQASALARTEAGKKSVLESDARKHPLIRSLVRSAFQEISPTPRDGGGGRATEPAACGPRREGVRS